MSPSHSEIPTIPGAWSASVASALADALASIGRDPGFAAFDWDDTVIVGDIGDAVFRAQLLSGAFAYPGEVTARTIPRRINGAVRAADGRLLPELAARAGAAVDRLRRPDTREPPPRSFDEMESDQQDAVLDLVDVYRALVATPQIGERFGFRWLCFLLAGLPEDRVERLVEAAICAEAGPSRSLHWSSRSGRVVSHRIGLAVLEPMLRLLRALIDRGAEVRVISGSEDTVIRAVATASPFLLPVTSLDGMPLARDDSGRTIPLNARRPPTFRAGKSAVLRHRVAPPRLGLLAAGDSEFDLAMLRDSGARVRLAVLPCGTPAAHPLRRYIEATSGGVVQWRDRTRYVDGPMGGDPA